MFTSLSSCSCKTAHRWGSALMFLLPHSSQVGHQLEICMYPKCFICPFPHLPQTYCIHIPSTLERGTSEWVSEKQKRSLELLIQAESQLNEELKWYQIRSHHFCKTLVHYVGMKFQEEIQKAPRETRGLLSVGAHFTGPFPIQLPLQIGNTHV